MRARTAEQLAEKMRPFNYRETLEVLGAYRFMISGGPYELKEHQGDVFALVLPVNEKYAVEISVSFWDEYEVSRVKGGIVVGVETAFFPELAETAYRASCFVNVSFGDGVPW